MTLCGESSTPARTSTFIQYSVGGERNDCREIGTFNPAGHCSAKDDNTIATSLFKPPTMPPRILVRTNCMHITKGCDDVNSLSHE